jgi:hypothetical protein
MVPIKVVHLHEIYILIMYQFLYNEPIVRASRKVGRMVDLHG